MENDKSMIYITAIVAVVAVVALVMMAMNKPSTGATVSSSQGVAALDSGTDASGDAKAVLCMSNIHSNCLDICGLNNDACYNNCWNEAYAYRYCYGSASK